MDSLNNNLGNNGLYLWRWDTTHQVEIHLLKDLMSVKISTMERLTLEDLDINKQLEPTIIRYRKNQEM